MATARAGLFAVVADAFPKGCIPLPALPAQFWAQHDDSDRKYLKKKAWMPLAELSEPLSRWRDLSYTDAEAAQRFSSDSSSLRITGPRVHNTINRRTLTTGTGVFAPYMKSDTWFNQNVPLCVQIVLDETRIDRAEFAQALEYVGLSGFGRDASVGLGKYEIEGEPEVLPAPRAAKVHITLASCVLSSVPDILPAKTYYKARTHFGRHGDVLAVAGASLLNGLFCWLLREPVLRRSCRRALSFSAAASAAFRPRSRRQCIRATHL